MASTYLSKTFGSAGNQKTFTWSGWVKRSKLANSQYLMSSYFGNLSRYSTLGFNGTDNFTIFSGVYTTGGSTTQSINLETSRVFRDPSAWYHIVVAVDTTQATSTDRVKLYVNGVQETSFTTSTYPAQNGDVFYNSTYPHYVGSYEGSSFNFDGCMSHVHWIDGTAYPASTFGEFDANGVWKPKTAPSVTYGTNGFFLKMENSGSMGTDSSGNANNFTVNGTLTQTVDSPSNVYATWNPLDANYYGGSFTNGNTTTTTGTSQYTYPTSTLGVSSGKWYWEVEYDSLSGGTDVAYIAITSSNSTATTAQIGNEANQYAYYKDGRYFTNSTGYSYGDTFTTGDIIGIALDLDNNKLYFSKNGTWQNSGDPTSGATGTGAISITDPSSTTLGNYFASVGDGSSTYSATFKANFGNGYFGTTAVASAGSNGNGSIFEYDVPSGYYALNTKNLATYG